MLYDKPTATIMEFDNSDVITGSCTGPNGSNCGHQTSGNSCNNNMVQKFDNCTNLNHTACGELSMT